MPNESKRLPNAFLLLLLAFCWGFSLYLLKKVLVTFTPYTAITLRLFLATAILYGILKWRKESLNGWKKYWYHYLFMGLFSTALPFTLIAYSIQTIPTTIAGIIHCTPSLFTAFLAHYFMKSETISIEKFTGLTFGIGGVLILLVPALLKYKITSYIGIGYILLASLSYSIGMLYSRKYLTHLPPLIGPTNQLLYGALITLPFAIYFDSTQQFLMVTPNTLGFLLALSFFSTALTFITPFQNAQELPTSQQQPCSTHV